MSIADRIISRAKRTPYFHLPGYMDRFWVVPYREAISRATAELHNVTYDGTGPVAFRHRPFAWLLQRFDIAVRVHHILRSDEGRDPHDHPWPYLTAILKGGYFEHRFNSDGTERSVKWHGPGSVLFRPANSWHMLKLPPGQTAWTLFITGKYQQGWGFLTATGKESYRTYLGRKQGTQ